MPEDCRVYWGTHGCKHERGHGPEVPHECACCDCPDHARDHGKRWDDTGSWYCVAKPPYYGAHTQFFGEDAETGIEVAE